MQPVFLCQDQPTAGNPFAHNPYDKHQSPAHQRNHCQDNNLYNHMLRRPECLAGHSLPKPTTNCLNESDWCNDHTSSSIIFEYRLYLFYFPTKTKCHSFHDKAAKEWECEHCPAVSNSLRLYQFVPAIFYSDLFHLLSILSI